jgi:hypothetical protein
VRRRSAKEKPRQSGAGQFHDTLLLAHHARQLSGGNAGAISQFRCAGVVPPLPQNSGTLSPMADHPHTIDRWDDATGENLIEQIAAVGDYLVALEAYRAAVRRWPKDKIMLRNRARVLERSWED